MPERLSHMENFRPPRDPNLPRYPGLVLIVLGSVALTAAILQPTMAIILGIRIGLADARAGHPPFLSRLIRSSHDRWGLVRQSIGRAALPLPSVLVMDSAFQYLTLGCIRIPAAVVVGILLVWLPFSSVRGLANRVWTHHRRRTVRRAA